MKKTDLFEGYEVDLISTQTRAESHTNVIKIMDERTFSILMGKIDAMAKKIDAMGSGVFSDKRIYSIKEACNVLKVSSRSLQRYRDEGKLAFSQVGGKIYFRASDIDAFLSINHVEPFKTKQNGR